MVVGIIELKCCPNPSSYYYNSKGVIKPVGCKSMLCPYCGVIRKMKILNDVQNAFGENDKVRFCTLTLRRYTNDHKKNNELNKKLSVFWARLRARLAKIWKWLNDPLRYPVQYKKYCGSDGHTMLELVDSFKWFYSLELTKKGMLHMHILWNIYIDGGLLSRLWYDCTDKTSWWVDVRPTLIYKPSGYVCKYLTKSFEFDIENKRLRRYGFSRNIERFKFVPDEKYTWLPKYAVNPDDVPYAHYDGVDSVIRERVENCNLLDKNRVIEEIKSDMNYELINKLDIIDTENELKRLAYIKMWRDKMIDKYI